ncbi:uncharacterized protein [Physcomitrium patens]|uniref:uncharacterized protein isoform X2 n=1 Tax=Physcomitrium patens TaxID=3218 RepID=UPI003CCD5B12
MEKQKGLSGCHCKQVSMWNVILVWACLLSLVRAEYNCSMPNVIKEFNFDFLRTFQKTSLVVRTTTFDAPDKQLSYTMVSKDTNRKITMWAWCTLNDTQKMCESCLNAIIRSIYELCCEESGCWGGINLRSECSFRYNASDYVIPDWTDEADKETVWGDVDLPWSSNQ